jgi:hypothetical protein
MTERRNLEKDLQYYIYNDPEYGEDIENISYPALIELLGELLDRVEKLEAQVNKPLNKEVFDWNETGD